MILCRLQNLFYRVRKVLVHLSVNDWTSNAVAEVKGTYEQDINTLDLGNIVDLYSSLNPLCFSRKVPTFSNASCVSIWTIVTSPSLACCKYAVLS